MKLLVDDTILIEGVKNRERAAMEALYRQFAPVLFSILLRYIKLRADAEDLLQETFLKIFANIHQFNNEGSFEGWLKRIAVNMALNHIQANKRKLEDREWIDEKHANMLVSKFKTSQELEYEDLQKLIQLLPEQKRLIFTLYDIEGFKHAEIAEMLKITEAGCRSQLAKAREMLAHLHKQINQIKSPSPIGEGFRERLN